MKNLINLAKDIENFLINKGIRDLNKGSLISKREKDYIDYNPKTDDAIRFKFYYVDPKSDVIMITVQDRKKRQNTYRVDINKKDGYVKLYSNGKTKIYSDIEVTDKGLKFVGKGLLSSRISV